MIARTFVILAAVLFVVGAAVASVDGPMMPLVDGMAMIDHNWIGWLDGHSSQWLKRWVLGPVLVRPAWLLPVALGVVAIGLAASLNSMRGTPLRRKG